MIPQRISLSSLFLVLGDALVLYASLFLALLVRYGSDFYERFVLYHFLPFTILFALWIVVFYVAGLYDLRRLRNNLDFLKTLWLALLVNAVLSVFLFYLVPSFGIAPKTNLSIFMVIFAVLEVYWRRTWNTKAASVEAPNALILVGTNETANEIAAFLELHPQLGYRVERQVSEHEFASSPRRFTVAARSLGVNLVVIPRQIKNNPELTRELYALLHDGVEIRDLPSFYELILRKVPLADLEESWFLEHLVSRERFSDQLKRAGEFVLALLLAIVLLPIELFIACIIALTSPGPVVYHQARTGENGEPFTLHKFRTMSMDAEKNGAEWSTGNDPRVTRFGRFLRYTHLDELPQLINIIRGDLSFVGPRPERQEFVKLLQKKIPYYDIRLLVKPGLTGWAQINYRYGSSVEDAYEKLQYDIYYIKNRSLIFDLAIILKTIKSFFVNYT